MKIDNVFSNAYRYTNISHFNFLQFVNKCSTLPKLTWNQINTGFTSRNFTVYSAHGV